MTHESCSLSCSLSSAQLRARTTHIDTILRAYPHEQTRVLRGRRLVFDANANANANADAELEQRLRELVQLESECCPFLDIKVTRDDEELVFTVVGPENGQEQIADLFG